MCAQKQLLIPNTACIIPCQLKHTGLQIAIRDSRFATRFQVFRNHFSQKTKEIAIQKTKQVQI